MGQITIQQRQYIIEQHSKWIPFYELASEIWFTPQEVTCVYLYKEIPESDFIRIDDGDMFEMTVAHVVNKSTYTKDDVRRLLREFTASELITWNAIKINKSKNYWHVNMDSSIL